MQIVCHRGANQYAPENTFAAARICLQWPVDFIEIDVRTSKDGVMYILHDHAVDRTTNGRGDLTDLMSSEIDLLDAGTWFDPEFHEERIPRVDAFLRWVRNQAKVFFDVKNVDLKSLVKLIYDEGFENDCFLWSGDDSMMMDLRKMAPELPLKVNVTDPEDVLDATVSFGARIVEFREGDISEEMLEACKRLGVKSMAYYQGKSIETFRTIIEWGVDMINLNHVDIFLRALEEMASERDGEG